MTKLTEQVGYNSLADTVFKASRKVIKSIKNLTIDMFDYLSVLIDVNETNFYNNFILLKEVNI